MVAQVILVGQYDSPYVRRVAVSLRVLGFAYEHDQRSVFGDFDAMRLTNPLSRVPSLVLEDGEVLIDSAAILDHLDEIVGPERALLPGGGASRREALRRIALAAGVIDKIGGGLNYERMIRPERYRWLQWMERVMTQGVSAIEALERLDWPASARLGQADITTACVVDYVRLTAPDLMPAGRYARLDALLAQWRTRPEFVATAFSDYNVPRG